MYWHKIGHANVLMELSDFYANVPRVHDAVYCRPTSKVYLVAGDIHDGLGVSFAIGRKDHYAVILIRYYDGQPSRVYYPNDTDWLSSLKYLVDSHMVRCDSLLSVLRDLMQKSVGRSMVTLDDLHLVHQIAAGLSGGNVDVRVTLSVWLSWFLYACIAEENYVSASGCRTCIGGLVKIAAYLEHVIEGMPLQDACDHYKAAYFSSVYGGIGSPAQAVQEKCLQYGICRRVLI